MTIENRLARLEATRKAKKGWRILFEANFPSAEACAAEAARIEAEGVRTWVVKFVEPIAMIAGEHE
jgi:hypothetical protein